MSSSVFFSGAVIQCSIQPRGPDAGRGPGGLDALGASHSAPGAVRVVALWEPATVACYSVALFLVSSGVFILRAVIQCSVLLRGLCALGALRSVLRSALLHSALCSALRSALRCCILRSAAFCVLLVLRSVLLRSAVWVVVLWEPMPVAFFVMLCWFTSFSFAEFLLVLQLRSSVSSSGFIECFMCFIVPLTGSWGAFALWW